MNTLGQRLRELREKTGLTQPALAFELDVAPSTVSNYENDRREPTPTDLLRIAKVYEEFIGDHAFYLFTGRQLEELEDDRYILRSDVSSIFKTFLLDMTELKALRVGPNTRADDLVTNFLKRLMPAKPKRQVANGH